MPVLKPPLPSIPSSFVFAPRASPRPHPRPHLYLQPGPHLHKLPIPGSRPLHLAPPFLVDDPYVPRLRTLEPSQVARKRAAAHAHLAECNLCPRRCGVNRYEKVGVCMIGETTKVNVIAPHFGEEPFIQGHNGSGSVFFSGCSLKCTFCQNHSISHIVNGEDLTPSALASWYLKLQCLGNVHNINLVTPEHVVPQVALSLLELVGREQGDDKDQALNIPVIYNTSSYDSLESLRLMDGLVDIYLADFKTWTPASSRRLLKGEDYPETARESIAEMQRQVGDLCFGPDGVARKGLLVRHLVMPGLEDEGRQIMKWLASEIGTDVFVNVMDQYRPAGNVGKSRRRGRPPTAEESSGGNTGGGGGGGGGGLVGTREAIRYPDLNRPVREDEVSSVRKAAEDAGIWRFVDPPRHEGFGL